VGSLRTRLAAPLGPISACRLQRRRDSQMDQFRPLALQGKPKRAGQLTYAGTRYHFGGIATAAADTIVKGEEALSLGLGRASLRLIPVPTPRWPGPVAFLRRASGLLIAGKFFAANALHRGLAERQPGGAARKTDATVYDCLMAPMARQDETVVDRPSKTCRSQSPRAHGPAISESLAQPAGATTAAGARARGRRSCLWPCSNAKRLGNTAAIADACPGGFAHGGAGPRRQLRIRPARATARNHRRCDALADRLAQSPWAPLPPPDRFRPWAPCWPKPTGQACECSAATAGAARRSTCWKRIARRRFRFRFETIRREGFSRRRHLQRPGGNRPALGGNAGLQQRRSKRIAAVGLSSPEPSATPAVLAPGPDCRLALRAHTAPRRRRRPLWEVHGG